MKEKYRSYINKRIGPNNILCLDIVGSDKNYKLIGEFLCPYDNTVFKARVADVKSGNTKSCGCFNRKNIETRFTKYYPGDRLGPLNIYMVERLDSNKGKFICPYDNEIFTTLISNIITGHTKSCGCLKRNKSSYGEQTILKCLKELDIKTETEKIFDDCINPKTGNKLRFDFYLPDYNVCIEYDGEQHFEQRSNWHHDGERDSLEARQYRDYLKNKYCEAHNIKMIRIPYYLQNEINTDFIKKIIN